MIETATQDRAAERLAFIKGAPIVQPEEAPAAFTPAPAAKTRGLGPNQLAWLRAEVPAFATCERLALAAEDHRRQMLEAVRA